MSFTETDVFTDTVFPVAVSPIVQTQISPRYFELTGYTSKPGANPETTGFLKEDKADVRRQGLYVWQKPTEYSLDINDDKSGTRRFCPYVVPLTRPLLPWKT